MKNDKHTQTVKFISYSGKFPHLCSGCLIVEIDGEIVKFGHDALSYQISTDSYSDDPDKTHYDRFWVSGGCVRFDSNWNPEIKTNEWKLGYNLDPKFYGIAQELIDCMNENVEWGCCGGCI